jgi:hypothetical protein
MVSKKCKGEIVIGWKDLSSAKVVTDGNREWICLSKPEDLDNVW